MAQWEFLRKIEWKTLPRVVPTTDNSVELWTGYLSMSWSSCCPCFPELHTWTMLIYIERIDVVFKCPQSHVIQITIHLTKSTPCTGHPPQTRCSSGCSFRTPAAKRKNVHGHQHHLTNGCDPTDHKKRGGACAATCIEVVPNVVRAIQGGLRSLCTPLLLLNHFWDGSLVFAMKSGILMS